MIGYGNEFAYARTRLIETIVMYNGQPVWVKDVVRDVVDFSYLRDYEERGRCKLKELDINPVPLGYVNSHNTAIYYTRIPVRRDWRQGLRNTTIRTSAGPIPHQWERLADTIEGKYPSLEEAERLLRSGVRAVAFSRNFAISAIPEGNLLEYKGKFLVGNIFDRRNYNLNPKFQWVEEALEEELAA